MLRPVRLQDGRTVRALAYLVNRRHPQYARRLDHARLLELVLQGHGQSGSCRDYVLNTLASIRELGIRDHALEWLSEALSSDPLVGV